MNAEPADRFAARMLVAATPWRSLKTAGHGVIGRRRNMRMGSRQFMLAAAGITAVSLIGAALAASGSRISTRSLRQPNGIDPPPALLPAAATAGLELAGAQAAAPAKPQMAEDVFKNIQVLKGIPVDDFMGTMGVMSAALGFCCSECHTGAGTDTVKWELDTPNKVTARRMVTMVTTINKDNFAGRQLVTCWTCHRGRDVPVVTPTLDTVYGAANLDPYDVVTSETAGPTADQILDKYIQAVGGAQRLAAVTSYAAKGTSVGFGGFGGGHPVEIFAKAPDQRATYMHSADPALGDKIRTYDGREGWITTPLTVMGKIPLSGGELDGARLDAQMAFPGQIKQILTRWRVGSPTTIDDRDVDVVQGSGPRGLFATLYFDKQTNLLTRMVRFSNSPIGRVPTQVDYADYRDVSGIKVPFTWTFSWLDGRDAFQLSDVQLNVPIDAAKFGSPPTATAPAK
jgi:photosynthetic reaction center cytochrome c subunit